MSIYLYAIVDPDSQFAQGRGIEYARCRRCSRIGRSLPYRRGSQPPVGHRKLQLYDNNTITLHVMFLAFCVYGKGLGVVPGENHMP
jgi:hypothetical protein